MRVGRLLKSCTTSVSLARHSPEQASLQLEGTNMEMKKRNGRHE